MKNAFLHGDLEKKIHVTISLGFGGEIIRDEVFKLKKALYTLRQSLRT